MRVRVKICGITNIVDALLAAELGADAIGLNFYAKSLRCIDKHRAVSIVQRLPLFVEPIPVVVNESLENAKKVFPSRLTQIYNDRHEVIPYVDFRRWIPAFPVSDAASLAA